MKKLFIAAVFAVTFTGLIASCENESVADQDDLYETTAEDKDLEEDKD